MNIGGDAAPMAGDHAAREETSCGLALLPEFVDLGALTEGRGPEAWPGGQPPPANRRHPGVEHDPAEPRYAQLGEDPRQASAARVEAGLDRLVEVLAGRVLAHLQGGGASAAPS